MTAFYVGLYVEPLAVLRIEGSYVNDKKSNYFERFSSVIMQLFDLSVFGLRDKRVFMAEDVCYKCLL